MSAAVSAISDYSYLALRWTPEDRLDSNFRRITWVVLVLMLGLSAILSSINIPVDERRVQPSVSERVAQFIIEKEKAREVKPKIVPKAKPAKKKQLKEKPKAKQPVTKKQERARDVAVRSGMLALSKQLSDLMDTSEVSSMINKNLSNPKAISSEAATFNKELLLAGSDKGSDGISSDQYISEIRSTRLNDYQKVQVKQTLVLVRKDSSDKNKNVRTREDIAIVFDQNKSGLYASYNRARRKTPGLKGKIVLQITIAPSGKVIDVKIISSELNDSKLEKRLVARIKTFDFGAKKVGTIIVTYPIEFLSS